MNLNERIIALILLLIGIVYIYHVASTGTVVGYVNKENITNVEGDIVVKKATTFSAVVAYYSYQHINDLVEYLRNLGLSVYTLNYDDPTYREIIENYFIQAKIDDRKLPIIKFGKLFFVYYEGYKDMATCPFGLHTLNIGNEEVILCRSLYEKAYLFTYTTFEKLIEACKKYQDVACYG